MPKTLNRFALLAAVCVTAACGKAPALAALKAADAGIETARPEMEKYVPQEFKALADLSSAAHDRFNQGDYGGALAQAQNLPPRVQAALAAARAKKEDLAKAWAELGAGLPALQEGVTARLQELSKKRRLPAGLDKEKVARARAELDAIGQTWTEATASYQKGDVLEAVAKAKTVKARIEGLMTSLGMASTPPGKGAS